MSPAQAELLRRLINADRTWRTDKDRGLRVTEKDRGVEVGAINGVAISTARSLCEAGLAEMVADGYIVNIYLGEFSPYVDF